MASYFHTHLHRTGGHYRGHARTTVMPDPHLPLHTYLARDGSSTSFHTHRLRTLSVSQVGPHPSTRPCPGVAPARASRLRRRLLRGPLHPILLRSLSVPTAPLTQSTHGVPTSPGHPSRGHPTPGAHWRRRVRRARVDSRRRQGCAQTPRRSCGHGFSTHPVGGRQAPLGQHAPHVGDMSPQGGPPCSRRRCRGDRPGHRPGWR